MRQEISALIAARHAVCANGAFEVLAVEGVDSPDFVRDHHGNELNVVKRASSDWIAFQERLPPPNNVRGNVQDAKTRKKRKLRDLGACGCSGERRAHAPRVRNDRIELGEILWGNHEIRGRLLGALEKREGRRVFRPLGEESVDENVRIDERRLSAHHHRSPRASDRRRRCRVGC